MIVFAIAAALLGAAAPSRPNVVLQRDEVDAAIEAFERAVDLVPNDGMFLRNLEFARGIKAPRER